MNDPVWTPQPQAQGAPPIPELPTLHTPGISVSRTVQPAPQQSYSWFPQASAQGQAQGQGYGVNSGPPGYQSAYDAATSDAIYARTNPWYAAWSAANPYATRNISTFLPSASRNMIGIIGSPDGSDLPAPTPTPGPVYGPPAPNFTQYGGQGGYSGVTNYSPAPGPMPYSSPTGYNVGQLEQLLGMTPPPPTQQQAGNIINNNPFSSGYGYDGGYQGAINNGYNPYGGY